MLNTPKTFEYHPELKWATYIADCITLLGFTAEMVTKINHMGLYSNEKSYLKDKWCRFDARYVQGVSSGFDKMYLALADRNMHVRFDLMVVWES